MASHTPAVADGRRDRSAGHGRPRRHGSGGVDPGLGLRRHVFRIKTPDGTLVVKVDDPKVKVQIDGDTVVIGGAGPQEVRLRAGSHRVKAIKDGKPVRDQLVTITQGGKEIVNIEFEPALENLGAATVRPSGRQPLSGPSTGETTVRLGRNSSGMIFPS